ncbi:MAG: transporter substrate-binding domain-containing protein [Salinisphaera sp.]|jgi:polar amino acid transport system substrate-binding protein|nr:transporter substrate-binding domain-containing protein [Salinisphaera sp.]
MRRLFCSLVAAVTVLASPALLAKTYVAGIEPSFPPWASVDQGQFVGIAPDAVRAIAKQQGFDVKFRSLSFDSLIPALKAGKIDILVTGLTVTPARAKQIDFSVPWWTIKLDVLVPKDSKLTAKTALSDGHTVGVQTGTTNYEYLRDDVVAKGNKINIKTYAQGTTALQDLLIGRLDAQFLDDDTARQFMAANPGKLRIAGEITPNPPQVYALGVKKGNTALLKKLNAGEVAIYKSGQWKSIVHKYMPNAKITPVPGKMSDDVGSYQKPVPGLTQ